MIFRNLKAKMFSVYIILVLLTFGISISFIFSLFNLGRTINSLMQANYISISATQNMLDALAESQRAIFTYIFVNDVNGMEQFIESNNRFNAAYLKAAGNITELGESEIIKKINISYQEYRNSILQLQGYKKVQDNSRAIKYYNDVITKKYDEVKNNCKQLLILNENAMFSSKNRASESTNRSIYVNVLASTIAIILGLTLLSYVLSDIFRPIHQLTNLVKLISEGDLEHKIDIKTNDEIGQLAEEFNKLTKRLQHYEQMSIKKLVDKKINLWQL